MLSIKKILLPVDFPNASPQVVQQAAVLAHHFESEMVLLHVVTEESHAAGVPQISPGVAGSDMLTEMIRAGRKNLEQPLKLDLDGLTIRSEVLRGDPAHAIARTAQLEKADLIMMASHGSTFDQFLLGAVTMKVLNGTECPIWTGAHVEKSPVRAFAIRNILCAVDLGSRSWEVVQWAAAMAAEFGAHLTVTHVTSSVELWGPGGDYVDQKRKQDLVGNASERMAKLLQEMAVKADVLIGSGDVPRVLNHVAKQTNADLLVAECYPFGGNLRLHGFAIISAVSIPVLNV